MAVAEKRLHLGCELNTPEDWINLDGSWGAWLAKYPKLRTFLKRFRIFPPHLLDKPWSPEVLVHDLRKPLPFNDDYLTAIYASHVLEHLYRTEAQNLLRECYRVLAPGGVLRVVVPDLRAIIDEYLAGESLASGSGFRDKSLSRADLLNQRLLLREESPPSGNLIYKIYSLILDFHSHKWMYDAESLSRHFRNAGFEDLRLMQAHESRIQGIQEIEQVERIVNGAGICIEGLKPKK